MTGYFRAWGKDFLIIAEPLYRLHRKNARFQWGKEQQESFDAIKSAVTTEMYTASGLRERKKIVLLLLMQVNALFANAKPGKHVHFHCDNIRVCYTMKKGFISNRDF